MTTSDDAFLVQQVLVPEGNPQIRNFWLALYNSAMKYFINSNNYVMQSGWMASPTQWT